MITAARNGKHITRNSSYCKRVEPSLAMDTNVEEEEEEDDLTSDTDPLEIENYPEPSGNVSRRCSTRSREPVRRYGQNIYEQY